MRRGSTAARHVASTFAAVVMLAGRSHASRLVDAKNPESLSRLEALAPKVGRSASLGRAALDVSSPADGQWTDLPPPQRAEHSAIYDSLRDRMLVFGGVIGFSGSGYSNETWSLDLSAVPTWGKLATSGNLPDPTATQTAIYDPVRDRMLLLIAGGFYGVWALKLSDHSWTQLSPSGSHPLYRFATSAVYDPLRDRVLVFGGYAPELRQTDIFNEVWALGLSGAPTWTQLSPSGTPPSPRHNHAAIYDGVRDRMVVFGGEGDYGVANGDVWALGLSDVPTWLQLAPAGFRPSPRAGSLTAFDTQTDQMLVFGGNSGPGNDLWALSLADPPSWAQVKPPGVPPTARSGASLVLDSRRRRLLLYGGGGDGRGWESWSLDLGQATSWGKYGSVPQGRDYHSAVCDPASDRMIVFGGFDYATVSNLGDLWARDLGNDLWTQLTPSGAAPAAREDHSAVLDSPGRRMILFGGGADSDFNDVWALSLDGVPGWSQLNPTGVPPAPRWAACAIDDPVRNQMVVFGGASSGPTTITLRNDVWSLSLGSNPSWAEMTPIGTPPTPRMAATAIFDPSRDRMLIFGGDTFAAGIPDTIWVLAFSPTPAWSFMLPPGSPGGRAWHSAVYDPRLDRMIVFGGFDASTNWANDVWALTLSGVPQWTQLQPGGFAPNARIAQTAVYDGQRNRMLLFGGFTPGQGVGTIDYNDTWALTWGDVATVVLVSVLEATARDDEVHLIWYAAGSQSLVADVQRRLGSGSWSSIGRVSAEGDGRLVFDDTHVTAASRYGYRIAVQDRGSEAYFGEVWVDVPPAPQFALPGARPNPSNGELTVAFSLPDGVPARIEVVDLAGRRVLTRDVGGLGSGSHLEVLTQGRQLPTGVYLVRLTRAGRSLTTRCAVVR